MDEAAGVPRYNLNGVNPVDNPGTYHFKAGVAGKTRKEVRYVGRFDAYTGSASATCVHVVNRAIVGCKRMLDNRSRPVATGNDQGEEPGILPVQSGFMSDHISVCVCTFRRNDMLRRLLYTLSTQETQGLFDYSIVVIDNDARGPAKECVAEPGRILGWTSSTTSSRPIPSRRRATMRCASRMVTTSVSSMTMRLRRPTG